MWNGVQDDAFRSRDYSACIWRLLDGRHPSAGSAHIRRRRRFLRNHVLRGGGACPSEASCGTVFRITPAGAATTLYAFSKPTSDGTTSYADGYNPTAFLIRARDGNFYGTTESGGLISQSRRTGTIFRLTPSGLKTILYNFGPLNEAPSAPIGGLIEATDGTFYGVTSENGRLGSVGARSGAGTVFKMVVP